MKDADIMTVNLILTRNPTQVKEEAYTWLNIVSKLVFGMNEQH